jgi:dUTPase
VHQRVGASTKVQIKKANLFGIDDPDYQPEEGE